MAASRVSLPFRRPYCVICSRSLVIFGIGFVANRTVDVDRSGRYEEVQVRIDLDFCGRHIDVGITEGVAEG
jgi:hypothetical protein